MISTLSEVILIRGQHIVLAPSEGYNPLAYVGPLQIYHHTNPSSTKALIKGKVLLNYCSLGYHETLSFLLVYITKMNGHLVLQAGSLFNMLDGKSLGKGILSMDEDNPSPSGEALNLSGGTSFKPLDKT